MNQTLFCLEIIISLCVVCGVADKISDTTDPSDETFTYCDGSGWVAYKDEKCFKLINKWATRDEAELICNQEYFRTDPIIPTLVSIKSAAEQEYLTKFVFDTSGVNPNVWIGAKRRPEDGSHFIWNDGSVIDFTNWAEGSPTEETRRGCVEMQSELSKQFSNISELDQRAINGKWKDVTCNMGNWVLCQKLQIWTFPFLQKTFLDSRKELQDSLKDVTNRLSDTINQLDNTKNELTTTKNNLEVLQKNPIPIGFIYVQLSGQPEPWSLWGSVGWIEITSEYTGLFFRVLGGGSAHFGGIQEENSPRLTNVWYYNNGIRDDSASAREITPGIWTERVYTGGSQSEKCGLRFLVSSGEVRPRNQAVRIWKRT